MQYGISLSAYKFKTLSYVLYHICSYFFESCLYRVWTNIISELIEYKTIAYVCPFWRKDGILVCTCLSVGLSVDPSVFNIFISDQ